MIINLDRLENAFETALIALEKEDLPGFLKKRWRNALEKAKERLNEQPIFAWQPERLTIVSIPKEKSVETGCRFYWASASECRRIDKSGLCQAFFEGFPCWHRAAHLLLGIYFGGSVKSQSDINQNFSHNGEVSTTVDTFG
ncbi:MAG: hypothetical protein WA584_07900 [Pyrinomonadaceae bacterium]